MRTIVGKVEAVEGKFFAKDSSGNVIELHLGDMITSDMLVYGDKSNSSSSSIQIALVALGEIINLNGTEQQLFDSSLVADSSESEGINPENVKIALEKTALADKNEIAKDAKEELAILDETAAGEERAKSTDTVEGEFAARDGASVDISTDLRTASFTTDTNSFEPTKIIIEEPQTPAELTTVTLSLAGQAMTEEGVAATYTITTSKPVLNEMQIEVKISNITTNGDIVEEIRTVVIPTGSTSVTFSLDNVDDAIKENPEDYKVEITNVQNGGFDTVAFADKEVVTTITDEANPADREVGATVSITGDASVTEGAIATYTVHTDTVSSKDIVVNVTTGHITTQDGDYTPVTQAVTILAGDSTATFTVQTTDDNLAEPTETYSARIVSANGDEFEEIAISSTANSVNTDIVDNDLPKITINDMTVNEADGFMTFTVTLSNPSTSLVTVDYHTVDGTSTAGLDYTQTSGTLTFTPGATTQTITVPVNDDFINEGSETLDLVLTNATNATITDNTGLGIIQDEPTPGSEDTITVTLSGDASVTEGATATYTVTISENALTPMDIDVVVGHDTTNNGDLTARTITVTVPAGSNSVDFTVSNNDDVYAEGDETYVVALSGLTTGGGFEAVNVDTTPVNTVISDNTIPNTEVDEEAINVTLSGDETVAEGSSASYTITLDSPTKTSMQVEVQTGHTTTDDGDLIPTTMMVEIPANATSVSFTVANTQDAIKEGNEEYTVKLTGNTVGGGFETLNVNTTPVSTTINDDDVLSIRINNVSVNEDAGSMTFVVSLSTTSASDVTFDYASLNQTALDGLDYTAVSGSGIITAGNLTTTITVPVTDDYIKENSETLLMNLTNVTPGVVLADVQGVGTILDEGTPGASDTVTVSLAGSSDVNEGNAATYTVSTDKAVETDMTVDVTYSFTSASSGDIVTNTVQVTIPAGATTASSFNVATVDDVYAEGDEVFNVTISNPQGGGVEKVVLGTSTVATTIHDDKTPGTEDNQETALVSITGASDVNEGNAALYTVSVDSPTTEALNVSVTYSYTSASSGDIVTNTVLVTIPANSSSVDFNVATVDDAYAEGDEVYNVTISNPVGGGFENVAVDAAQATVATTIYDNTTPGTEDNEEVTNVTLSGATTVAEGGVATYTITLDAPTATPMQVEVQTGHITTENGDLIPTTVMVEIPANASTVDFTVANNQDLITEGNEDYNVVLTGLTNGGGFETINVNTTPVVTTIIDDEGKPSITINDVTVNEDAGTMEFTVTLSNPTTEDVTFNYASADQSAVAGADYTAVSGLGTITAGTTTTTIIVPITDDYIAEANEKFVINLTNPSANAVIADVQGVGTITDEPTPSNPEDTLTLTLSGDLNVEESNSASYRVTADKAPQTDLTVTIKTGHTDTVTGDFIEVNTTVTIPANQTFVDFSVQTNDDAYAEGAERYTVTMSNPVGGGVEAIALGNTVVTTTINDEASPASEDTATVSISGSTTVVEGEVATYTVSVNRVPITDLFVDVETGHITTENGDYTPVITTVKIAAGTQSAQFTVNTLDDALAEVTEDYKVSITDVNGGGFEKTIIGVSQVVTAITDEINPTDKDVGATLTLSATDVTEDDTGVTFTATLDKAAITQMIVTTEHGDIIIDAGSTTGSITLNTQDSDAYLDASTISATVSNVSGGGYEVVDYSMAIATANISDTIDNTTVTITTTTPTISEDIDTVTFDIQLSNPPQTAATVQVDVNGINYNVSLDATGAGTFTVNGLQDSDVYTEAQTTLTATVTGVTGGNYENVVTGQSTAVTINDSIDTVYAVITGPGATTEGATTAAFTVSLVDQNGTPVTVINDTDVTVVFANGTAENGDYVATTQTVTIPAGSTSATFSVQTNEDVDFDNETFTATLDSVEDTGEFEAIDYTNAPAGLTNSVTAEIIDNDSAPNLRITDVTVNEDAGTMTFTVSLNHTTTADVTFNYASADNGSATAGLDYTPTSGANGLISAGDMTFDIIVPISDDYIKEGNETFLMNLSNVSSNIDIANSDLQGVGTITDAGSINPPQPEIPGAEDTITVNLVAVDAAGNVLSTSAISEGETA
ncbi:hypothetical protein KKF31_07680, partial [bacterium]|nr:hypothetical protein [bacterium]